MQIRKLLAGVMVLSIILASASSGYAEFGRWGGREEPISKMNVYRIKIHPANGQDKASSVDYGLLGIGMFLGLLVAPVSIFGEVAIMMFSCNENATKDAQGITFTQKLVEKWAGGLFLGQGRLYFEKVGAKKNIAAARVPKTNTAITKVNLKKSPVASTGLGKKLLPPGAYMTSKANAPQNNVT